MIRLAGDQEWLHKATKEISNIGALSVGGGNLRYHICQVPLLAEHER